MTRYTGTAGDDDITGTTKNDYFDMSQGGDDIVHGGGGRDQIYFGAAFTADDQIDGGITFKKHNVELIQATVELDGDYSSGVVFNATTMVNVATLQLDGHHSYNLTLNEVTVSGDRGFNVDASTLGANDTLIFDASAQNKGWLNLTTNAGHFHLKGGATDVVFDVGANLRAGNSIDGSGGTDEVKISGNYTTGLLLNQALLKNVGSLWLGTGTFTLTTADDLVGEGARMYVYDTANSSVYFDGSAETDGSFAFGGIYGTIIGSANGDDRFGSIVGTMIAGTGNDEFGSCAGIFKLQDSGVVQVVAGTLSNGADIFHMGGSLTAADQIDGGDGNDEMVVNGDYSAGLVFASTTIRNIETLLLTGGHSYDFTLNDDNVAKNRKFTVDGSHLLASDTLQFNGSAEQDGKLILIGGDGSDVLIGGADSNVLTGGRGADTLTGGGLGNDTFIYQASTDSSGIHYDTIQAFTVFRDGFQVPIAVTGVDTAINGGALDDSSAKIFNTELAAAVDAAHLAAHHAVVFTPDSGSLTGEIFLIVDQNGVAGYQANEDLVIRMSGAESLDGLTASNFHT
jgi:Ca2+-binding RTX toxin-like protein